MDLRTTLPTLYAAQGYAVREDPNGCHALYRNSERLDVGLGASWADIAVWERLAQTFTPYAIFGIGNGFGWSTLALRLIWKAPPMVILDAETEGADNVLGNQLTSAILKELNDDTVVMKGASPERAPNALAWFCIPPGLVFIDGEHTTEAMLADFEVVRRYLAAQHIVFFHDVLLCRMQAAWERIERLYPGRSRLLDTPTGMGVVWTGDLGEGLK